MPQLPARTGASARRAEANDGAVGKPLTGLGERLCSDYRHRQRILRHTRPRQEQQSFLPCGASPRLSGGGRAGDRTDALQTGRSHRMVAIERGRQSKAREVPYRVLHWRLAAEVTEQHRCHGTAPMSAALPDPQPRACMHHAHNRERTIALLSARQ